MIDSNFIKNTAINFPNVSRETLKELDDYGMSIILKNKDIKIKQKIIINQKRYKKIILGKKGEMIKKIREDSQKKMSQILKAKIHLYLELIIQ